MSRAPQGAVSQARRAARIRRVVEEAMTRRAAGETLDDRALIASHADLAPELERELGVLRLLERARAPRAGSAGAPLALDGPIEPLGDEAFDGYRVAGEVHRGGQGVVYDALQKSTGRRVAIKVMREGLFAGDRDADRFQQEVRILGQLKHPGIVGILASGVRGGHFYYVMEFVEGEPIDRFAAGARLPTRDALVLFAKVCDAVSAAHVRGIIHRDLKPGNILVDARGEPHVLDFGLARIVSDWSASVRMTVTGQFVGSLPWASPEQAAGDQSRVDVRSDVYSLGVVLYQLLTGRFPYRIEGPPRDVLNDIQSAPPARPRSIVKDLDESVEAITLKCLAKERERRYQSASELADDIRRHLEGRPITARPPSVSYQLRTFARRNKALVAGSAAVLLTLSLGLLGTTLGLIQASAAREGLRRERDAARAAEHREEERRVEAERSAYVAGIAAADAAIRAEDAGTAKARLAQTPEDLRGWEWRHLAYRADRSLLTLPGAPAFAALVSPDGASLAVVRQDDTVDLLDGSTFEPLWTVRAPISATNASGWLGCVSAFSRDGSLVVTSRGTECFAWAAADGRLVNRFQIEGQWGGLLTAISPDNRRLAANGIEGRLRVWDIASGEVLFDGTDLPLSRGVDYSPDGRLLGVGVAGLGPVLLDARSHEVVRRLLLPGDSLGEAGLLQFSPDGATVATAWGFDVLVVGVADGRVLQTLRGHTQRIASFRFSPDGARIVTGSLDRTVRLWDAGSGRLLHTFLGHVGETSPAGFTSGDGYLVSSSTDGTVKLWDPYATRDVVRLEQGAAVHGLAFTPRSELLSLSCFGAVGARAWDTGSWAQKPIAAVPREHDSIMAMPVDGARIAYRNSGGSVSVWDAEAGRALWHAAGHGDAIRSLAFSPDGARLASCAGDRTLRLWRAVDGSPVRTFSVGDAVGPAPALFPGEHLLVLPLEQPALVFYDLATGAEERVKAPDASVSHETLASALSPDGSLIATGHAGGLVILWDVATRHPLRTLRGMDPAVWSLAFSPDGSRLATGSQDRLARIWDHRTGEELLVLRGHRGTVIALAWSPDGRRLASGSYDTGVMIWDAAPLPPAR
ncbi:MAG: WD40 repeat domain-containing serine/threonine protein kinase [Phycisphaerales bacterium]